MKVISTILTWLFVVAICVAIVCACVFAIKSLVNSIKNKKIKNDKKGDNQ